MEEQKLKTKISDDTIYATSSRYSDTNIYKIDTLRMAEIWRSDDLSAYVRIAEEEKIDLTDKPLVKERLETFKKAANRKFAAEYGYYLVE